MRLILTSLSPRVALLALTALVAACGADTNSGGSGGGANADGLGGDGALGGGGDDSGTASDGAGTADASAGSETAAGDDASTVADGTSGGDGAVGGDAAGGDDAASTVDTFNADSLDFNPCPSGKHYTKGKGMTMEPGNACIQCHAKGEGPFPPQTIAGTVYPNLIANNRCNGITLADGVVTVEITDANNKVIKMSTNAVGNFASSSAFKPPYTARIYDDNGNERKMNGAQTSGDCNTCHTPTGANKAPGRIVAPAF